MKPMANNNSFDAMGEQVQQATTQASQAHGSSYTGGQTVDKSDAITEASVPSVRKLHHGHTQGLVAQLGDSAVPSSRDDDGAYGDLTDPEIQLKVYEDEI